MPQQIKEKIIEEFREKYSKSPYQLKFKIHTGGFVNNDYELKDAIEDVEDFILKALSLYRDSDPADLIKVKRIYKYGTGDVIPEGAVYLTTIKQTEFEEDGNGGWRKCWLVWHYFLIEKELEDKEK